MQLIVEIDGILFDVRAATWEAYSQAVVAIGLARTDETTLWRLVRTGGGDGQMVRGARPHQLEKFRQAFESAQEADEIVTRYVLHDAARDTLRILHDLGPITAVTCGSNVTARHRLLRENGLGDAFPQLTQVPAGGGPAALQQVAARRPEETLTVVIAATAALAKVADDAGFVPIGISSGPAIAKRLAAAGARATYPDVIAFAAALEQREEPLRRAGLVF